MHIHRFAGGVLTACALAALGGATVAPVDAAADNPQMSCAQVTTIRLPDVKITSVVPVPAAQTSTSGAVRAPHCKVNGVIGAEIKFVLLLPDTWNQKFMMGGGGGFVGTVDNQAAASVNQGFATVGTDTGHTGTDVHASRALNNVERRVNFGNGAVHGN